MYGLFRIFKIRNIIFYSKDKAYCQGKKGCSKKLVLV